MEHEIIIRTEELTKRFKTLKAVSELSLNVKKGEIYGFLGLNGAGKTTTIRMLLGMVAPTSGAAYIKGKRITPGAIDIWRNVGYMVETPSSYPELTVQENLEIIHRLRDLKAPGCISSIMKKLSLEEYRQVKAKHLSLGNAQRLGLAKAMLHEPEILLLDEPANGLDPSGIVEIRQLLMHLAKDVGATVFISSHILGEVSKFADRIGIIHEGELLQELDNQQLSEHLLRRLELKTSSPEECCRLLVGFGCQPVLSENGLILLTDKKALAHPEEIAKKIVENGFSLFNMDQWQEDLEAYFLRAINN